MRKQACAWHVYVAYACPYPLGEGRDNHGKATRDGCLSLSGGVARLVEQLRATLELLDNRALNLRARKRYEQPPRPRRDEGGHNAPLKLSPRCLLCCLQRSTKLLQAQWEPRMSLTCPSHQLSSRAALSSCLKLQLENARVVFLQPRHLRSRPAQGDGEKAPASCHMRWCLPAATCTRA